MYIVQCTYVLTDSIKRLPLNRYIHFPIYPLSIFCSNINKSNSLLYPSSFFFVSWYTSTCNPFSVKFQAKGSQQFQDINEQGGPSLRWEFYILHNNKWDF